jgi:cytosine/adenosine deaminase-related metal-dependent hydrolase
MKTLWRNATLIAMDDANRSRPFRGDLLVDGALIAAVGAGLEVPADTRVVDAQSLLITPGFVNAHMHSWETLFRGTSERLPLELWSLVTYPVVDALPVPDRLVYLRTLVAGMDALRGGTTSLLDDVGELPVQSADALATVFQAYAALGIRATCTGGIADIAPVDRLPFVDELLSPAQLVVARRIGAADPDLTGRFLRFCREAFARHHGAERGRLRFAVAPSAPQRCTDDLLTSAAALAVEHDAVLHMHLLETKLQAIVGLERYNSTIVEHLSELGILDTPNLTLAHGIWLTEHDIELLASSSAVIVHNPLSNLKLGSGVLPWRSLHSAGATVALGTDGTASNDSLRMLEVVKQAALLHTLFDPDPASWPSTDEVLWAATRAGAEATGLPNTVGALEAGRAADFVVFDLEATTSFTPARDIARQLVFAENGSSIAEVWVDGEVVVRDGRMTRVDEAAILAEFRTLAAKYHSEGERMREANEHFVPLVAEVHRRASQTAWPPALAQAPAVPAGAADAAPFTESPMASSTETASDRSTHENR